MGTGFFVQPITNANKSKHVIPANAGIQWVDESQAFVQSQGWIPAFAGMTIDDLFFDNSRKSCFSI